MSEERDQALDAFFEEPTGRARSAGDAVVITSEALYRLEAALEDADGHQEDSDFSSRSAAAGAVFEAALALGRASVDALNGLVLSNEVDNAAPSRERVAANSQPLEDSWQRSANPYRSVAAVALAQRERLAEMTEEPSQLFRRLHDTVALAADLAAWSTWSQLE